MPLLQVIPDAKKVEKVEKVNDVKARQDMEIDRPEILSCFTMMH